MKRLTCLVLMLRNSRRPSKRAAAGDTGPARKLRGAKNQAREPVSLGGLWGGSTTADRTGATPVEATSFVLVPPELVRRCGSS